jgi:hypothetical protein
MKNTTKTNSSNLITNIANTKGRFFGLYLTNGEVLNAQFRSQTDSYITVYDRKARATRKLRKTSLAGATV